MKRTIVQEFGEANRPPLVRGYANAKVGQQTKKSKLIEFGLYSGFNLNH